MDARQYCTILTVERVVCTEIFGFPFWVGFIKLIDQNTDTLEGIIYFTKKADALKLQIGDQVSNQSVFHLSQACKGRDTSFNG